MAIMMVAGSGVAVALITGKMAMLVLAANIMLIQI